ncbi:MAG: DMT family transporter [Pirellulales bacterium]|nr:DMT family transporter [Pirellulales bacterium]
MDTAYLGALAAVATALLWTLSSMAWTSAGREIGALACSFLRLIVTIAVMELFGYATRGAWLPVNSDPQAWVALGISGFFGFFVCDLLLFESFLLIGPRLSLLIHSLSPPMSALISAFYLGDRLEPIHWLGMAVTLSGVVWVVLERPDSSEEPHERPHFLRGVAMALTATISASVGYVLAKQGMGNCDPVDATLIRILGAMTGYVLLLTLLWRWPRIWQAAQHRRAMLTVCVGAVIGPFLGVTLCMVALRYSPVGVAVTIISTMPVLILPFAIIVHKEKVTSRAAVGALVSVAGVVLLVL